MKVTVLIPTFNYDNYILNAIASIFEQNYPQSLIEIIVVDDGSTDNTQDILHNLISNKSIIYHFQNNQGKAAATQKGIDLSNGEIIFNLDADDYFYPNKISDVVQIFKKYPNVTHVGHPADISKENKIQYSEDITNYLLNKPINGKNLLTYFLKNRLLFGGGSTFAARAQILRKIKIPTRVDMYTDEYLIYATTIFGASYFISKPLSIWRVHGKNYSVDKSKEILEEKNKRLLSSSATMLDFLSNSNLFSQEIIRLYELKHLDRLYSFKEKTKEKDISDILRLIAKILTLKYSMTALHTYRIFYRLVPIFVIDRLRKHVDVR